MMSAQVVSILIIHQPNVVAMWWTMLEWPTIFLCAFVTLAVPFYFVYRNIYLLY